MAANEYYGNQPQYPPQAAPGYPPPQGYPPQGPPPQGMVYQQAPPPVQEKGNGGRGFCAGILAALCCCCACDACCDCLECLC
ncbi:hypothetical protein C7212DRAFT_316269 [Tuber magnatum]|uniref:Uncharacterized protein n=1 Tax=Tuber magnatum TaxID=42249 RepID=A0A317SUP1_9PEZI|nr:hypothetical protein C7212DRAFT_316269 [Tuber magnatum]